MDPGHQFPIQEQTQFAVLQIDRLIFNHYSFMDLLTQKNKILRVCIGEGGGALLSSKNLSPA